MLALLLFPRLFLLIGPRGVLQQMNGGGKVITCHCVFSVVVKEVGKLPMYPQHSSYKRLGAARRVTPARRWILFDVEVAVQLD